MIEYHLTPEASKNNAFTDWRDGRPSIFCVKGQQDAASLQINATKLVEKKRKDGTDKSNMGSLSKKTAGARNYKIASILAISKNQISIDPNPQASADKQRRIKR